MLPALAALGPLERGPRVEDADAFRAPAREGLAADLAVALLVRVGLLVLELVRNSIELLKIFLKVFLRKYFSIRFSSDKISKRFSKKIFNNSIELRPRNSHWRLVSQWLPGVFPKRSWSMAAGIFFVLGPDSTENFWLDVWPAKWLEFWLETPYTGKIENYE